MSWSGRSLRRLQIALGVASKLVLKRKSTQINTCRESKWCLAVIGNTARTRLICINKHQVKWLSCPKSSVSLIPHGFWAMWRILKSLGKVGNILIDSQATKRPSAGKASAIGVLSIQWTSQCPKILLARVNVKHFKCSFSTCPDSISCSKDAQ